MRNSRRVNATLIIAIAGSCLSVLLLPASSLTPALGVMPQEMHSPIAYRFQDANVEEKIDDPINSDNDSFKPLGEEVEITRLDDEPTPKPDDATEAAEATDTNDATEESKPTAQEDKWALDDDDRMTEEEMNKELFGDDDSESELDSSELSSKDSESDSDTDDRKDASRKPDTDRKDIAPRQTTEEYLQNINSLTINTTTPPSTSREGIDVPMRIMPFTMQAAGRAYPVTGLRYQTPDIYHNPLYFEDRAAERGGVDHGLRQPVVSARKFAVDVLTLPRKKRQARPRSCEYHQNLRYAQPSLIRY